MSKRNLAWLVIVLVVGALVWVTFGVVPGLVAVGLVLVASEVVERRARTKRRAAQRVDKAG